MEIEIQHILEFTGLGLTMVVTLIRVIRSNREQLTVKFEKVQKEIGASHREITGKMDILDTKINKMDIKVEKMGVKVDTLWENGRKR